MRWILPAWLHAESPCAWSLSFGRQHFLYFLPLPQGQGSFLCGFMSVSPHPAYTRGSFSFRVLLCQLFLLRLRRYAIGRCQTFHLTISLDAHAVHGIASAMSV